MTTVKVAPGKIHCIFLEQIPLKHGHIPLLPEDKMVQHLDAQQITGLPEPSGDILVLDARLEVAAWMVVGHHDGGRPLSYRFSEDLQRNVMWRTVI